MKVELLKYKSLLVLISLFVLVLLSHGKTMQMYYWVDDWAMTYKVLWPEEAPGNMGKGVFGDGGPYRYLVTPFIALYPIFGFNAFSYFAIGWFLYFLAACSVYLLIKELTQKKNLAFASAAIFASGFIGSHALYRLTNSYQTVGATMFICLAVWLYAKYLRKGFLKYYWLSFIIYIISIEIFFIRTHGLLLSLLGVTTFYALTKIYRGSIKNLILRLIPFTLIFYFMYFLDPRIIKQSDLVLGGMEAIKRGEIYLFNNLFINLSNALVVQHITTFIYNKLAVLSLKQSLISVNILPLITISVFSIISIIATSWKELIKRRYLLVFPLAIVLFFGFVWWSGQQSSSLWRPKSFELFTSLFGGIVIIMVLFIATLRLKVDYKNSLLIILALFWVIVNSITLFIYSPETNLESNSRYFVPAFVGIALLYAAVFLYVKKRILGVGMLIIICLTLIYYSNQEADMLIRDVTLPDKQGYSLITQEVKKVDRRTVFYIETDDEPKYKGNYLGRLPQLGISSLFNYHGITTIADSYDHLFSLIKNGKTDIGEIYTYYFGPEGYKSTTTRMRELLQSGSQIVPLNNWTSSLPSQDLNGFNTKTVIATTDNQIIGVNPSLEIDVGHDSLVPSVLELTMSIQPMVVNHFPYFDVTKQYSPQIGTENIGKIKQPPLSVNNAEILAALKEESTIQFFRNRAQIKATSSWSTTEVEYLIDGNEDTNWGADNNQWSSVPKPQDLTIDLGQINKVTKLIRINHYYMATPTAYSIFSSSDGINWVKVLEVDSDNKKEGGEIIQDKFSPPLNTRFIKMNITKTFGGPGYPPAIRELWISNLEEDIDPILSKQIVECPFCHISDQGIASSVMEFTKSIAKARIWWETDRKSGYSLSYSQEFPVVLDGQIHTYKIYLPAQGTKFKKFKISGFQLPVEVALYESTIKSLSLEELQQEKRIK